MVGPPVRMKAGAASTPEKTSRRELTQFERQRRLLMAELRVVHKDKIRRTHDGTLCSCRNVKQFFKDMHVFTSVAVCECMLSVWGCLGEPECLLPWSWKLGATTWKLGLKPGALKSSMHYDPLSCLSSP